VSGVGTFRQIAWFSPSFAGKPDWFRRPHFGMIRRMESTLPRTATTTPPALRRRGVWIARLAATLIAIALGSEIVYVSLGRNFHTLIPGEIYRAAQLTPSQLEATVKQHGIRTVVNLRGRGDGMDWYDGESYVCQATEVSLENISLSAVRLPSKYEVRKLVETLDRAERPLLLHCRQGADRTGLAAAITLLLMPDVSYSDARAKMGLRWGHWHWGPAGALARFFTLYEKSLSDQNVPHSPDRFRHWVNEIYQGGACCYEVVEIRSDTLSPKANRPYVLHVRLRNTSDEAWHFHAFSRAGIHLFANIIGDDLKHYGGGSAGVFERTVAPGEEVDLTLGFAPLPAGRYRLRADLNFGEHGPFYKFGQEPIERELIVRE
jgi:protein tyrosine phosphatase (PTP) superfamily phosphohydrolase (DUF442 family)